jgi:hypothetical protein
MLTRELSRLWKTSVRSTADERGRIWGTGLTRTDAEDLLDCLEVQGHDHCQVSFDPHVGFQVTEGCAADDTVP